jgi:hypothetical protein
MFQQQNRNVWGATFDNFRGPIMARRAGPHPDLRHLREESRSPVGRLAFSDSVAILQSG